MKARKTEEQFDSDTAQRLRNLQRRLEAIRTTGKASDYFLFEAAGCLDRGLILGALQLATAALELRAREILVQYAIAIIPEYDGPSNDVESAFEADRGYFFYNIVAVLRGAGVIDIDDQIELIDVYKKIRIPLHHGIVGRYAGRWEYDETIDLLGNQRIYSTTSDCEMEEVVETKGVHDLNRVVLALELLALKARNTRLPH